MKVMTSKSEPVLPKLISKFRKDKGYTQEELAILSKVKKSHLANIERGKTIPRIDEVIRITKALGLDLKLSDRHFKEEIIK